MSSWLDVAAARRPQTIALEGPGRAISYLQLRDEARRTVEALKRQGFRPGDQVALELAPGEGFVIALHACMLAGAVVVPIDLRLTEVERARRRLGCQGRILERGEGGDLRFEGGGSGIENGDADGGRAKPGALDGDSTTIGCHGAEHERVLALMHTSGTTREPKRVALTFGNFLHSALASAAMLGLDPQERWLCPMPLTHVGGLSIAIRSTIYATGMVLHGRFDTASVLDELMDPARGITLVSLVPTMLARLLDAGLERPPTLRWVLLGGGPIAPALIDRAERAGVPVAPTYGMTEACSQIATFGFPLPGVELRLEAAASSSTAAGASSSADVGSSAAAAAGEICVRGPIVSPGALAQDGWLHTGDLGTFDARGRLQIVGRVADTIVTGGENVAPAEVEAVLLEHPDVTDAGVFGRPDPEWGEAVVACVVLRDGAAVSSERLREFCAERIARHKVPKQISFISRLPRTASGKLLRRQLS